MSDSGREQRPLLYEDISEEEHLNIYERSRPMVFRGRAKNNVKGAAAIIKLWPGYWSSAVTYWWIGLGMIAIITFMIYNSIGALAVASAENFGDTRAQFANFMKEYHIDNSHTSETSNNNIYMHLFIESNVEIDINDYIPYIDRLSARYPDFNYHFIIVSNDTDEQVRCLRAEENNEIALDLLWNKKKVKRNKDVNIVQVTLSRYMESSPLREHWKKIPKQFLHFLTRAVSIWDKGGIAFDPKILQPRANCSSYSEKLHKTIVNFQKASKKTLCDRKPKRRFHQESKKINNIRDIIDALENDRIVVSDLPQNLVEAESKPKLYVADNEQVFSTDQEQPKETHLASDINNISNLLIPDTSNHYDSSNKAVNKNGVPALETNDTIAVGLLPKFLGYLFEYKPNTELEHNLSNQDEIKNTRERKHILVPTKPGLQTKSFAIYKHEKVPESHDYEPIIFTSKAQPNDSTPEEESKKEPENETKVDNKFTIDLRGSIIASLIPCHAFLGTIFSHASKYTNESVTDFIITELSVFCKGVLSTCNGIDVILL